MATGRIPVPCITINMINDMLTPTATCDSRCSRLENCCLYRYQPQKDIYLRKADGFPCSGGICILCMFICSSEHLLHRMIRVHETVNRGTSTSKFVRVELDNTFCMELYGAPFDFSDGNGLLNSIDVSLMPDKIVFGGFPVCHEHEFVWGCVGEGVPRIYMTGVLTTRVTEWIDCRSYIDTTPYENGFVWGPFSLTTSMNTSNVSYSNMNQHIKSDARIRAFAIIEHTRHMRRGICSSEYDLLVSCIQIIRKGFTGYQPGMFASWAQLRVYIDKVIKDMFLGRYITHSKTNEDTLMCNFNETYQSPPAMFGMCLFDMVVGFLGGDAPICDDVIFTALQHSPESFRLCVHVWWLLTRVETVSQLDVDGLMRDADITLQHVVMVRTMIEEHPFLLDTDTYCKAYKTFRERDIALLGIDVYTGSMRMASYCTGGHIVLSCGILDVGGLPRHVDYNTKLTLDMDLMCFDNVCTRGDMSKSNLIMTIRTPFFIYGLACPKVRRPDIHTTEKSTRSGGYFIIQPIYYMCVPRDNNIFDTEESIGEYVLLFRTVYNKETDSFLGIEHIRYVPLTI